ncbi:MAG: hypothetical protein HY812_12415 [Planctomycetes bacterium]|nr:hypothetical protein [Planctomycetota bacterium]
MDADSSCSVALPLLCHDWSDKKVGGAVAAIRERAREHARLLVYPECSMAGERAPAEFLGAAQAVAERHGVPTVCGGYLVENDDRQVGAALANPRPAEGEDAAYLYRKHTQSPRLAFDNADWITRFEDVYLKPVRCAGRRIGLTLCHDQTLSLLQRSLVRRGADLLINPSGSDVVHAKWALWMRCRALENGVPMLCTMWSSSKTRKRGYVLAIGPRGEELPLEFVPAKGRARPFTAASSLDAEPRADGFYLVRVPLALARPDLPQALDARGARTLVLVGVRKGRVLDRAELNVGGAPPALGANGGRSAARALAGRRVVAVLLRAAEIFAPEVCARALLRAEREHAGAERPFFVLLNAWPHLPAGGHGEALRVVAAARALEHACVVVLAGIDSGEPLEAFSSTLYRVSRRLDCHGATASLDLDANALQSGGPGWFFSRRADNDFSSKRLAYEALLASCEASTEPAGNTP